MNTYRIDITDGNGNWVEITEYVIPDWNGQVISTSPFATQDSGRVSLRVVDKGMGRVPQALLRNILLNRTISQSRYAIVRISDQIGNKLLFWGYVEPASVVIENNALTSFTATGLLSYGEKKSFSSEMVSLPAPQVAEQALTALDCQGDYKVNLPAIQLENLDWNWDFRQWFSVLGDTEKFGLGDAICFLPPNPGNYTSIGFFCCGGRVYRLRWNDTEKRVKVEEVLKDGQPVSTTAVRVFWMRLQTSPGQYHSCLVVVNGQYRGMRSAIRVPWNGWGAINTIGQVAATGGAIGAYLATAGVIAASSTPFAIIAAAGITVSLAATLAAQNTGTRHIIESQDARLEYTGFQVLSIDDDFTVGQGHTSGWYFDPQNTTKYIPAIYALPEGAVCCVIVNPENNDIRAHFINFDPNLNGWVLTYPIFITDLTNFQPTGAIAVAAKQVDNIQGWAILLGGTQSYLLMCSKSTGGLAPAIIRNWGSGLSRVPVSLPGHNIGVLVTREQDGAGNYWFWANFVFGNGTPYIEKVRMIMDTTGELPEQIEHGTIALPGNPKIETCSHPAIVQRLRPNAIGRKTIACSYLDASERGIIQRKIGFISLNETEEGIEFYPATGQNSPQYALPAQGGVSIPLWWYDVTQNQIYPCAVSLCQDSKDFLALDVWRATFLLTPFVHHNFQVSPMSITQVLREICRSFGAETRLATPYATSPEQCKLVSKLVDFLPPSGITVSPQNVAMGETSVVPVDWIEGVEAEVLGEWVTEGQTGLGKATHSLSGKWMTPAWARVLAEWYFRNFAPPSTTYPYGRRLVRVKYLGTVPSAVNEEYFLRSVIIDPAIIENCNLSTQGQIIGIGYERSSRLIALTILEGAPVNFAPVIPQFSSATLDTAPQDFVAELVADTPHYPQMTIGWCLGGNWGERDETISRPMALGYLVLVTLERVMEVSNVCIPIRSMIDFQGRLNCNIYLNQRDNPDSNGVPGRMVAHRGIYFLRP
ncbi:hypothetical protein, partial [Thermogutta sp.]|uniref:hypothetical protein n=1 Tax=Thermogutta sp. TaxID=1962930 RepID=UPI003220605B